MTLFMTVITSMVEILFVSMVIAILYWCIDKEKSRRLAWIVFFSAGINSLIKNINLEYLIVTRSENGISLIHNSKKYDFPAKAKDVIDVYTL
mgnify:CR=1 FL=1